MTLHILFLTITIKKRTLSTEEIQHEEMVNRIYEENKDRQYSMHRMY
ncbi:YrzI family small protein [Bacillus sp. 03113]|nr:YrzI family small protein [Bacillus sp. 03113]